MALSKLYTQKKVKSVLMRWVNQLDKKDLAPELVVDFINLATLDTAEILNGAKIPDYGRKETITDITANEAGYFEIDISTLKIDKVTKLESTTVGDCIEKKEGHFNNVKSFDEMQYDVYWYQHGEKLYGYKGGEVVTMGDFIVSYNGFPAMPVDDDGYLDIRDKYIPLVIAKAKNHIYEHLELKTPQAILDQIDAKTAAIRNANMEERRAIKSGQSN